MSDLAELTITHPGELRTWLAAHHDDTAGVWLITWKKAHVGRHVPWPEVVDELLCWGWIDSQARPVDADRSAVRISPRRPGSPWSLINRDKVVQLRATGRMTAAGEVVIARAVADGSWSAIAAADHGEPPDDLREALAQHASALDTFIHFPLTTRRAIVTWIVLAKRPETRAARVKEAAEKAARGERAR